MTHSLYAHMYRAFPADGSRPLLWTDGGHALSYAQVHEGCGRLASFLAGLDGVGKGDRIAVQVEKSPEALILYLACLRAGLVFLPMNSAYTADEVSHLVGDAAPKVLVCRPEDEDRSRAIAGDHGVPHLFTLDADGTGSLTVAASTGSPDFGIVACAAGDLAAMLYTSGTTGKPKGAMLSHDNLLANGRALVESWRFTAADVLLHALPIHHAHGLFVACHCVLLAGAGMVWLPRFDVDGVIDALPRASVFMGVPTFYTRLLASDRLTPATTAHMRLFTSGSAPLLAETHSRFTERTGHAILERYGMTETGMNTGNPYDGERRPGSVGVPFPGVEVRVVGDDGATPLPPETVGAIQVKGANVMVGYWGMPEKTREEFTADSWFKTGDQGLIDGDGYLHIVGRAKDMIISGGFNVYPKEVESVIDALPGVVESAVVGVPHPDFGEAAVAVVVGTAGGRPDEAAILRHLKAHLANYKVPKRLFFVDELPRNTMGKVGKALLRERHAGLFAADA
jgi:malonyl-CoA/methylmalonyl-CoA synthetase